MIRKHHVVCRRYIVLLPWMMLTAITIVLMMTSPSSSWTFSHNFIQCNKPWMRTRSFNNNNNNIRFSLIYNKPSLSSTTTIHLQRSNNNNKSNNNNDIKRTKLRKRDTLPLLFTFLTTLLTPLNAGAAVIGYIPKGARDFKRESSTDVPRPKIKPSEEYLQKLEEKGGRFKEIEMKVLKDDLSDDEQQQVAAEEEEDGGFGGLRPGTIAEGTSSLDESEKAAKKKKEQVAELQRLQLEKRLEEEQKNDHKISSISSSKSMPTKISKKAGLVAAGQFTTFITVGVVWARFQSRAERIRLKKGIEIYESQKAEYFNITGSSESDEDIAESLRNFKNVTMEDNEDDDDEDEDEEPPLPPKRTPGGGRPPMTPSPSSGGDKGGDDDKPSQDDIDQLNRMFKKT